MWLIAIEFLTQIKLRSVTLQCSSSFWYASLLTLAALVFYCFIYGFILFSIFLSGETPRVLSGVDLTTNCGLILKFFLLGARFSALLLIFENIMYVGDVLTFSLPASISYLLVFTISYLTAHWITRALDLVLLG